MRLQLEREISNGWFDVSPICLSRVAEEFLPRVLYNLCIFEPRVAEWVKKLLDHLEQNAGACSDRSGQSPSPTANGSSPTLPEIDFFRTMNSGSVRLRRELAVTGRGSSKKSGWAFGAQNAKNKRNRLMTSTQRYRP